MKHIFFSLTLAALTLGSVTATAHTEATLGVEVNNNKVTANLKLAKKLMSKSGRANYDQAKKLLEQVLAIDPDNTEAKELLQGYYLYRAERRLANDKLADAKADVQKVLDEDPENGEALYLMSDIEERVNRIEQAWSKACAEGSPSALDKFKKDYPKSEHVKEIADRKADYQAWQTAISTDTKEAYETYLSSSKYFYHKDEAKQRIATIEMEDAWNAIKNTNDYRQLEAFAEKYPSSPYANDASFNSKVIQGNENYDNGNHDRAYQFYQAASAIKSLPEEAAKNYRYIQSERKYNSIANNNDASAVRQHLNNLSESDPFYGATSDHLALLLAERLNAFSSDAEMDEPETLAFSSETKERVDKLVSHAKTARAAYLRKRWWKNNFKIGIIGDFEGNVSENDGFDTFELVNWSAGLAFRFGGASNWFDVMAGVKYRSFLYVPNEDNFDGETETLASAIAIPAELHIKLGGT